MSHYLGLNVGTSGTKTLLINAAGDVIAEADATYPMDQPKPGWTQQDPEDWWKATVKTVRAVMRKSKCKPEDVKAIGLSGQTITFAFGLYNPWNFVSNPVDVKIVPY